MHPRETPCSLCAGRRARAGHHSHCVEWPFGDRAEARCTHCLVHRKRCVPGDDDARDTADDADGGAAPEAQPTKAPARPAASRAAAAAAAPATPSRARAPSVVVAVPPRPRRVTTPAQSQPSAAAAVAVVDPRAPAAPPAPNSPAAAAAAAAAAAPPPTFPRSRDVPPIRGAPIPLIASPAPALDRDAAAALLAVAHFASYHEAASAKTELAELRGQLLAIGESRRRHEERAERLRARLRQSEESAAARSADMVQLVSRAVGRLSTLVARVGSGAAAAAAVSSSLGPAAPLVEQARQLWDPCVPDDDVLVGSAPEDDDDEVPV